MPIPVASSALRNTSPLRTSNGRHRHGQAGHGLLSLSYVGGFAGTVKNADFLRCVNNGSVTSDGDYVSGFVPKSETTTYTACANNGAITGRTKIGGLGAEVKSTKVVDSCNTGAIGLIAYGTGKQAIGGLFAEIRYGSSITRSYNSGAVTGDCYVGGPRRLGRQQLRCHEWPELHRRQLQLRRDHRPQ